MKRRTICDTVVVMGMTLGLMARASGAEQGAPATVISPTRETSSPAFSFSADHFEPEASAQLAGPPEGPGVSGEAQSADWSRGRDIYARAAEWLTAGYGKLSRAQDDLDAAAALASRLSLDVTNRAGRFARLQSEATDLAVRSRTNGAAVERLAGVLSVLEGRASCSGAKGQALARRLPWVQSQLRDAKTVLDELSPELRTLHSNLVADLAGRVASALDTAAESKSVTRIACAISAT